MVPPAPDPRDRTAFTTVSWQRVAWSYLVLAGVWLLLVAMSAPIAVGAMLLGVLGVAAGIDPARRLVRCLRRCRRIRLDVGERLSVTVVQHRLEEPCCEGPAG